MAAMLGHCTCNLLVVDCHIAVQMSCTWRDMQYLIAYTSNRELLSDGGWHTNGAGLKVSHKFGFGAIDAEAMVTRAKRWIKVPTQHNVTITPSTDQGYVSMYILRAMHEYLLIKMMSLSWFQSLITSYVSINSLHMISVVLFKV